MTNKEIDLVRTFNNKKLIVRIIRYTNKNISIRKYKSRKKLFNISFYKL